MKAKISKKAATLLKDPQASRALMNAVLNNSDQLANGNAVHFTVPNMNLEVTLRRATSR